MSASYTLTRPLIYVCIFGQIVLVLLALLSVWLFFNHGVVEYSLETYWDRLTQAAKDVVVYSDLKKSLLVSVATISFFAPALILIGAFRVFRAFERGNPFEHNTVCSVRFLGGTIIAYALSKIISYSLVVLILTYDNPPGLKEFSIAVNGHTLVTLMIGFIILIIGHIFTQATKLAEENRQFV